MADGSFSPVSGALAGVFAPTTIDVTRRMCDPQTDAVIREWYLSGTHWDAMLADLSRMGNPFASQESLAHYCRARLGLSNDQRRRPMVPKKPGAPRKAGANALTQRERRALGVPSVAWTPAMAVALQDYAFRGATDFCIANLLSLDFGVKVTATAIQEQRTRMAIPTRVEKGRGEEGNAAAYALRSRRFWARDGLTRAEVLAQLDSDQVYLRVEGETRARPATTCLLEGRFGLADLIARVRRHIDLAARSAAGRA